MNLEAIRGIVIITRIISAAAFMHSSIGCLKDTVENRPHHDQGTDSPWSRQPSSSADSIYTAVSTSGTEGEIWRVSTHNGLMTALTTLRLDYDTINHKVNIL